MSDERLAETLEQLVKAARLACAYVEGMERADFLADTRTQQAVVMNLVIIGEAASRLQRDHAEYVSLHPEIPWRSMKGMRNRIAHGYFDIDMEIVWDTVLAALPDLLTRITGTSG